MKTQSSNQELPNYFRLVARGLKRAHEDDFTYFCFDHGAQGVTEDLTFTQPEIIYDPRVIETDRMDLNAYFEAQPDDEFLKNLKSQFPEAKVEVVTEQHQDWMENWKKGFEPFLFVEPFWIVPSWHQPPAEAKEVLLVDPGMAFGTGTHETTKLASRLIVQAWSAIKDASGRSPHVLDVGTGTGILGLVCHKLGAGRVVAIDNDPEARRVARENIALNKSEQIEVPETQLNEIASEQFDLVIANIIDGVLVTLREDLMRVLKPGGTIVLSGILTEREGPFLDQFLHQTQLRNRRRVTMNEWSAFLIK
jgi:ribosomal protein L11 methyltransferase